ncbi:helix-turn-helix transcriptional regulator [Paenibacillus sp. WLX1005]|uniref:helix-turn-helix transcriptional regulator n=1 Tax=Paenibacillus sp. WLX1005 TaxID=3243766 RepID=UPI0039840CBD
MMRKSERLQWMQRYVHRRQRFTLRQLMEEFSISRSTALRDIESLEEIGLPIYAEHGRHGGYRLLDTATLPPVSFTANEVLALYFSMQALQSFSGDAFGVSFHSIHARFLDIVTPHQRQQIEQFHNRISFYHGEQARTGEYLEQMLLAAVKQQIVHIDYSSARGTGQRRIQPFAVYVMQGYWYCQSYDLDKEAYRVFRCDRITGVMLSDEAPREQLSHFDLHNARSLRQPSVRAVQFQCAVDELSESDLQARLLPSMTLIGKGHDGWHVQGSYEPEEQEFILSYLSGFGTKLKQVEPPQLREQLKQYYQRLLEQL